MKKIYTLVLISTVIFTSCRKLNPEYKIVGTWKLDDVVKRHLFNNQHVDSEYGAGLFRFYDNGSVTYTDTVTLSGNWRMRNEDRGYYDNDGNWQQKNNLILYMHLVNFATNREIDWYFDEAIFKRSSDRLDGFMYYATSSYQYSFRRQ